MKQKLLFFFFFFLLVFITGCKTGATANTIKNTQQESIEYVKIPISEITPVLKKYTYNSFGVEVKYFAVLDPDGEIRTAFDACDVCGGYKGYRQNGVDVTCNNCGRSFRITDIGTKNVGGGCWPSYLSHKIDGDHILISKSELAAGAFRFA